jgi:hypothetical protein
VLIVKELFYEVLFGSRPPVWGGDKYKRVMASMENFRIDFINVKSDVWLHINDLFPDSHIDKENKENSMSKNFESSSSITFLSNLTIRGGLISLLP